LSHITISPESIIVREYRELQTSLTWASNLPNYRVGFDNSILHISIQTRFERLDAVNPVKVSLTQGRKILISIWFAHASTNKEHGII
jgi:hypothetical protein